jgi:hypothetical protein
MEQHPIPQQISSYQFRLVGDMTLKQFFQLAGGLLVALLFYSTPIIGIVKWPLVIISAILGAALAFVPLEERPLEKWIFAFFKAIYTPTEFYWKKTTVPFTFFQAEPEDSKTTPTSPQDQALQEYLGAPAQKTGPLAKLEGVEKGFLTTLAGMFAGVTGQQKTQTPSEMPTPAPLISTPAIPATNPPPTPAQKTAEEPKRELQIPQTPAIKVVSNVPNLVVEEKPKGPMAPQAQFITQQVSPIIAGEEIVSTKQAMFSIDATPPNPPSTPNVIVGQVVDENKKIIEGVIMEIRDSAGRPIRALRSNKAGHFITVTPLENGRYDVITDKDGYEFTPVSFEATGVIIPPILVQGKHSTVPVDISQTPVQTVQPANNIPPPTVLNQQL